MAKNPNILVIMVDQLNGTLFPDGPADWLHAPNLKKLAAKSVRFCNAYTASPLCAPARASFMSGQLPRRTGVYDNAAEFASDIPTYAHHLRRVGYATCLSGKMHFVGPDQMHGFEERLTTDVYPADFGWTPDYRKPGERIDWWYHNLNSVTNAGIAEISNQLEYDDEVAFHATQKIYDLGRAQDGPPWMLTVSFTHPHDPYLARQRFWDLYADCEHLLPQVSAIDYDQQDAHSKRIFDANDWRSFSVAQSDIMNSRRAYFANISYLDEKIGEIIATLEAVDQVDNTIILFVSDHGDMLGERGLWFKMNFFEGSVRVPLMISSPNIASGKIDTPVSTLDVTPTLCDVANIDIKDIQPWADGISLLPIIEGNAKTNVIRMEYAAEASYAPLVGIRKGKWKYIHCELDAPQLFNMEADPHELTNLAAEREYSKIAAELLAEVRNHWDMKKYDEEVRQSQARRWVVYEALRNGAYYPWDFQPLQKASERYMRNHLNLNEVEANQRYPKE